MAAKRAPKVARKRTLPRNFKTDAGSGDGYGPRTTLSQEEIDGFRRELYRRNAEADREFHRRVGKVAKDVYHRLNPFD